MAEADLEYGQSTQCNFPLFHSLKQLPGKFNFSFFN